MEFRAGQIWVVNKLIPPMSYHDLLFAFSRDGTHDLLVKEVSPSGMVYYDYIEKKGKGKSTTRSRTVSYSSDRIRLSTYLRGLEATCDNDAIESLDESLT